MIAEAMLVWVLNTQPYYRDDPKTNYPQVADLESCERLKKSFIAGELRKFDNLPQYAPFAQCVQVSVPRPAPAVQVVPIYLPTPQVNQKPSYKLR